MTKPLTLLTRMLRLQKLFSDTRKWGKGHYQNRRAKHTCYCFVGGLNKVRGKDPLQDFMMVQSDEAIALEFITPEQVGLTDTHGAIVKWNDAKERTIKDVRERVALGIKNARKLSKQKSTETT